MAAFSDWHDFSVMAISGSALSKWPKAMTDTYLSFADRGIQLMQPRPAFLESLIVADLMKSVTYLNKATVCASGAAGADDQVGCTLALTCSHASTADLGACMDVDGPFASFMAKASEAKIGRLPEWDGGGWGKVTPGDETSTFPSDTGVDRFRMATSEKSPPKYCWEVDGGSPQPYATQTLRPKSNILLLTAGMIDIKGLDLRKDFHLHRQVGGHSRARAVCMLTPPRDSCMQKSTVTSMSISLASTSVHFSAWTTMISSHWANGLIQTISLE
jgi:hypothetical protein